MSKHQHYPDVLLTTEEAACQLDQKTHVFVEVDLDSETFSQGHIPGAFVWNWETQLRDQTTGDPLSRKDFEVLMGAAGISNETKVVLYGDNNNWFACWAFWLMKLYGHEQVWLLDGGPRKWLSESRPISQKRSEFPVPATYHAQEPNLSLKATTEKVFESFFNPKTYRLLDVRSSAEFAGTLRGPGPGMDPTCQVAGHIPTSINIPWNLNCNADGTFKSPDELRSMYASFDIQPEMNVITYCAIGERASLSWFVLKHLLGYGAVMNYSSSMAQWSCIPNAPIVQGQAA
ncbi:MAG: sulfurtransferase [Chlorobia bacterium]|nr:sulfurtransferase [Fimbriimonadaceae bacterium]